MDRMRIQEEAVGLFNPLFKAIISQYDINCRRDGSLIVNSLKKFLGDDLRICKKCQRRYRYFILPSYKFFSKIMKLDYDFMRKQFLNPDYGLAWLKGFALMMKGIRKYGVRMPF
ncbi:hypothetical protein, partial [[Eubacterium] cellulosolvens]